MWPLDDEAGNVRKLQNYRAVGENVEEEEKAADGEASEQLSHVKKILYASFIR